MAPRGSACSGVITHRLGSPGNLPTHTACCCRWTPCGCSSAAGWSEPHPSPPLGLWPSACLPESLRSNKTNVHLRRGSMRGGRPKYLREKHRAVGPTGRGEPTGLESLSNVFFKQLSLLTPPISKFTSACNPRGAEGGSPCVNLELRV